MEAQAARPAEGARPAARKLRFKYGAGPSFTKALIVMLVVIGVVEGGLRFGLGLGNPVLIQADRACGYFLKPRQDVVRFFARTHTNQFGMRSDDLVAVRPTGGVRLMFVGDSIAYGTSRVDQEKIFTEILHRELPGILHRPVEVLNASASAWAPANELSYLSSRGVFGSDIVLLVLNNGDLAQPNSTIAEVEDQLPQRRPLTAIGELFTRFVGPWIMQFRTKAEGEENTRSLDSEIVRENLVDIDTMRTFATSHRARFVLIYVPFRRDIPGEGDKVAEILHRWSNSRGVAMFDLRSSEASHTQDEITLDSGIHLNAFGHRVIAEAIERSWPKVVEGH